MAWIWSQHHFFLEKWEPAILICLVSMDIHKENQLGVTKSPSCTAWGKTRVQYGYKFQRTTHTWLCCFNQLKMLILMKNTKGYNWGKCCRLTADGAPFWACGQNGREGRQIKKKRFEPLPAGTGGFCGSGSFRLLSSILERSRCSVLKWSISASVSSSAKQGQRPQTNSLQNDFKLWWSSALQCVSRGRTWSKATAQRPHLKGFSLSGPLLRWLRSWWVDNLLNSRSLTGQKSHLKEKSPSFIGLAAEVTVKQQINYMGLVIKMTS